MKVKLGVGFYVLLMAVVVPVSAKSDSIPEYSSSAKAYMAQSAKQGKASPFTKEEFAIMKRSGERLKQAMPEPGLKIGDKAPDFELPNAHGKNVRLSKALENGPVVLVFYRGAWCPFCNLQLHALNKSMAMFKAHAAQVIAITPQKPDKSLAQVKKDGFPFEILSDLDSKVMKSYKLYFELEPELVNVYTRHGLDLAEFNGQGRYLLPVPATYIVDRNGIIRAGEADTDYKKRMEPGAILEALAALKRN